MYPKNTPANQSLAKVIREKRKQHGHSIESLALRAGISPTHCGRIERGEMNPIVDALLKVTTVLGMTGSELSRGPKFRQLRGRQRRPSLAPWPSVAGSR
jgi:transcriptional regulator with XRE-family HTH domain